MEKDIIRGANEKNFERSDCNQLILRVPPPRPISELIYLWMKPMLNIFQ